MDENLQLSNGNGPQNVQPTQHVCPHCGYCPHCGRGGYVQPWYPYTPYTWPWGYPTITWGGTTPTVTGTTTWPLTTSCGNDQMPV